MRQHTHLGPNALLAEPGSEGPTDRHLANLVETGAVGVNNAGLGVGLVGKAVLKVQTIRIGDGARADLANRAVHHHLFGEVVIEIGIRKGRAEGYGVFGIRDPNATTKPQRSAIIGLKCFEIYLGDEYFAKCFIWWAKP